MGEKEEEGEGRREGLVAHAEKNLPVPVNTVTSISALASISCRSVATFSNSRNVSALSFAGWLNVRIANLSFVVYDTADFDEAIVSHRFCA